MRDNHIIIEEQDYSNNLVDVREKIEKYLANWYWILLSVFISILVASIYLYITPNRFEVNAVIFIDDKEKGGISSELSAFEDMGMISGGKTSIINEIGVLNSKSLTRRVIKNLEYNLTFYKKGTFEDYEIYKDDLPFSIDIILKNDSVFNNLNSDFSITIKSRTNFILTNANKDTSEERFNTNLDLNFGIIQINTKRFIDNYIGGEYLIKLNTLTIVSNAYNRRIKIDPLDKSSSLLKLTLVDEVKKKGVDILNSLISRYNQDAIDYKNQLSKNTDEFINQRIIDVRSELALIDLGLENYKTGNNLTDMAAEAGIVLQSNSEIENRIVDLNSQIRLVNYVSQYLDENDEKLIPSNLGLSDNRANQGTEEYNKLLMERDRIVKNSSAINPTVVRMNSQLKTLRANIRASLANSKSSLTFQLNDLKSQERSLNEKKAKAPKQEREFQDIKRKQLIIETLYLYLLEKREENAISLGIPVPNARVIDSAYVGNSPVSPSKKMTLLVSLIFGSIFPLVIIYIISLLDNKIHKIGELDSMVKSPIIGEIPKIEAKLFELINDNNTTGFAESFRLLRTNLQFMFPIDIVGSKTILITSTIPGEGKSSISMNLASVLSAVNKKVLLMELDLRKPKLNEYVKDNSNLGITDYLVNSKIGIKEIISNGEGIKFDFIPSGSVPPNPSSLLLADRMNLLMTELKKEYDYIILDSPPVTVVTDTLILNKYCNLTLYVVRANYLDKRILKNTTRLFRDKLSNIAIVFNASDARKRGYNYGYENEKK